MRIDLLRSGMINRRYLCIITIRSQASSSHVSRAFSFHEDLESRIVPVENRLRTKKNDSNAFKELKINSVFVPTQDPQFESYLHIG
jgi:hypothetical protein